VLLPLVHHTAAMHSADCPCNTAGSMVPGIEEVHIRLYYRRRAVVRKGVGASLPDSAGGSQTGSARIEGS
jgi:hypothetical protein